MTKTLFISALTPTMQYPQAGQRIAFINLLEYAALSEIVDVFVIANKTELDAAKDLFLEFDGSLYAYPLNSFKKIESCLFHHQMPFKFASRYIKKVEEKIQELLIINNYDIIHFECSHAAVYIAGVEKYINPTRTKTVISLNDVWTQVFLRQSARSWLSSIEAVRTFQYERTIYSLARELWVSSAKDRDLLTSLFSIPDKKITIKPHPANSFVYQVQRCPEKIEKKSLLFWAAMGRPENERAILIFIEKCFKKLIEQDRAFKLYIVGSSPSKRVLALASKQIIVTGFVEDPTEFFEKAEIGIVPLLEGGGIKLKTVEMLEAGLPVIATTIGAEGIIPRNKKLIVSDNFEDWLKLLKLS
jgi:glycosyltransferase involved in cell wall biosynthesis